MILLKPFTVVGVYEDNGQSYVDWVVASTPKEAEETAIKENDSSQLVVLCVFAGHLTDVLCGQVVDERCAHVE